jgi:hypothetical protein
MKTLCRALQCARHEAVGFGRPGPESPVRVANSSLADRALGPKAPERSDLARGFVVVTTPEGAAWCRPGPLPVVRDRVALARPVPRAELPSSRERR